jgi:predicted TIM-barrel fold metal-dependent hydrolase
MKDGYSIFDTHTHIGYGAHHGRRMTADELLRAMDGFGVDRSLVIPFPVVEDHRAAHDEIARAVKAHPDRFAGAACIYPYIRREEFLDEMKRCAGELGFRAIKLQPQYQPLNPLRDGAALRPAGRRPYGQRHPVLAPVALHPHGAQISRTEDRAGALRRRRAAAGRGDCRG